ncbi:MAG: hypothetical protein LBS15_00205 [Endomicrobium sp.]|jgi:hypothetical protein|nr:hypothetical protein [Endomicrobium sp.]
MGREYNLICHRIVFYLEVKKKKSMNRGGDDGAAVANIPCNSLYFKDSVILCIQTI